MNYSLEGADLDIVSSTPLDDDMEEEEEEGLYHSTTSMTKKKPEKAKWTTDEDNVLRQAVSIQGGKNWKSIAAHISGKTEVQCLHRWTKVLNPTLTKGPWTVEVNFYCSSYIYLLLFLLIFINVNIFNSYIGG